MSNYVIVVLCSLALFVAAQEEEDVSGGDVNGRTFGHLVKPLKRFTNTLGHYLVQATNDYSPYDYFSHSEHSQGGYFGGYNGFSGYHRPGFFGGYPDYGR